MEELQITDKELAEAFSQPATKNEQAAEYYIEGFKNNGYYGYDFLPIIGAYAEIKFKLGIREKTIAGIVDTRFQTTSSASR